MVILVWVLGSVAVGSKMFKGEDVMENEEVGEALDESTFLRFNTVGFRVVEFMLQLPLKDESDMMESMALDTKGVRVLVMEYRV